MKITRREKFNTDYIVDETNILKALDKVDKGEVRSQAIKFHSLSQSFHAIVEEDDGTVSSWFYEWDRGKRQFVWKRSSF